MFSRQHSSMEDILPDNVMCEVISRLPVKTIIRCKCVCKTWHDLVSDSYFVHLHLSRSREAALMILTTSRSGTLKWVELGHEAENPCVHVKWLDLMGCAPVVDCYQTLVGSVNGLICSFQFSNEEHQQVAIFNPVLDVGTLYVDATRLGSIRFGSTRLGSAQARCRDIPPSCAPEFDTRSTESREPIPIYTSP
ncbi:putative F-box domain-containing protein [Helianthus anomalus]